MYLQEFKTHLQQNNNKEPLAGYSNHTASIRLDIKTICYFFFINLKTFYRPSPSLVWISSLSLSA